MPVKLFRVQESWTSYYTFAEAEAAAVELIREGAREVTVMEVGSGYEVLLLICKPTPDRRGVEIQRIAI